MQTVWNAHHLNDMRSIALPTAGKIRPGETAHQLARRLLITNYPLADVLACRIAINAFGEDEWISAVKAEDDSINRQFGA